MTQATLIKRITGLEKEVKSLRSFMIGMAVSDRDPEGEYRPEFVKRILAAKREKPVGRFTDAKSFLAAIRKQKA